MICSIEQNKINSEERQTSVRPCTEDDLVLAWCKNHVGSHAVGVSAQVSTVEAAQANQHPFYAQESPDDTPQCPVTRRGRRLPTFPPGNDQRDQFNKKRSLSRVLHCDKIRRAFENTREM